MSNNFNINKNQPLVSIITPIYNAEKYLDRCLKSTINQTYGNIEIILINDGSTDNTKSICYHYESTNNNVVFINRDRNMGTIVSRKEGIKKATGEFIMFVDADDYILPNTVEKLIGLNANFSCDLLIFNMYYSKDKYNFFHSRFNEFSGTTEDFYKNFNLLYHPACFDPVCNKLYNAKKLKDCILSINDNNILMGEDLLFNVAFLEECRNLKIVNDAYYIYNKSNPNSITTICYPSLYEDEFFVLNSSMSFFMDKCKNVESIWPFVSNIVKNGFLSVLCRYIKSVDFCREEKFMYIEKILEKYKSSPWFYKEIFKNDFEKELLYLIKTNQYAGIYYLIDKCYLEV